MKILAIDFNSLMNRSFFAIRTLTAKDGTPTNALYGFVKTYLKLVKTFEPDAVIAAYDVHAPTFPTKAPARRWRTSCGSRCRWAGSLSPSPAAPSSALRAGRRTTSSVPSPAGRRSTRAAVSSRPATGTPSSWHPKRSPSTSLPTRATSW